MVVSGYLSDSTLGRKKFLFREALATFAIIESRAHAVVEGNTFPFLNGLGHFLPNRKLTEVTMKLESLEAEFQTARSEFMQRYADLRQDALIEWRDVARKTGGRSRPVGCYDRQRVSESVEARPLFPLQCELVPG